MDARAQKRTSAAASIFNNSTLLKQIFAWIGPGHHLFLATVCTVWQRQQQTVDAALKDKLLTRHYDLRQIAHEAGLPLQSFTEDQQDDWLHYAAGKAADLGTLHLAHELGLELNDEVLRGAAASASLPKLGWLHMTIGCELPDDICNYAASSGSVDVLSWLMRRGCTLDSEAYAYAAEYGQRDMLKRRAIWRLCAGCTRMAVRTFLGELAAEGGSIEALRYAKEQGCVFTEDVINSAARSGHVSVLEHLYAEQCPLPADTAACSVAFLGKHVGALRWLHEHGSPWDVNRSCKRAAQEGQPDTLAYMLEHAEPLAATQLTKLLFIAGSHKHLTVAQLLRQHGAQWPA
eukprot:4582-Heterococcus_DN1.PRE.1